MNLYGKVLLGSTIDRVWRQRRQAGGLVNGIVFRRTSQALYQTGELSAAENTVLAAHHCVEMRGDSVPGKP